MVALKPNQESNELQNQVQSLMRNHNKEPEGTEEDEFTEFLDRMQKLKGSLNIFR